MRLYTGGRRSIAGLCSSRVSRMKTSLYTLLGATFMLLPHLAFANTVDASGAHLITGVSQVSSGVLQSSDPALTPYLGSGDTLSAWGCNLDGNCNGSPNGYTSITGAQSGTGTSGLPTYDDIVNGVATINIGTLYAGIQAFQSSYCTGVSPAPCTGILMRDGGWTGGPPNFISSDPYITFTVTPTSLSIHTPAPANTFIAVDNPTQGTTTPSNTLAIDIRYGIGNDLSTFSIDGSLPSQVGINITLLDAATNQQINLGTDYAISQSVGTYTYATSTTLQSSDYTLVATLVGDYGFTPPPPDCMPFPPFTTCEGSGNISTLATALPAPTFSVNNGLFPILGFQLGSTTSRAGLATTTCSITSIGGCFQNALAFLFFPSPNILDQFGILWKLIENKPPFGYVSQTITGLRSLNASSTPAFSFGNIPLVSTIFTPFRTGLAAILWVGFFIAWYRGRLRHLDI